MTQFNVGDIVRNTSDYLDGSKVWGTIRVTRVSNNYVYGESIDTDMGSGCWVKEMVEHIEPAVIEQEGDGTKDMLNELEQLRKFKADAVAKYPDLVPMSAEEEAILAVYNEFYRTNHTHISELAIEGVAPAFRAGVKWGRDHAAD